MNNDLLQSALEYANRGWFVFPCIPGDKKPLTEHGFHDASTDPEVIARWWRQYPKANIGVAVAKSGLVLVDVDHKNGAAPGMESWRDLLQQYGREIADTVTQETPSGGLHLVYRSNGHPVKNANDALGDGIEVKSSSGYFVAFPSVAEGKQYLWAYDAAPDEHDLMVFPASLAKRLDDKPQVRAAVDGKFQMGQRHDAMVRMAGAMRRQGAGPKEIEAALLIFDQERCDPPKGAQEVHDIAYSMTGYKPAPIPDIRPANPDVHLTDWGNAEVLSAMWGDRLRYDHRRQRWLMWDGLRWREDVNGQIERIACDVARARYAAAANILDDAPRAAAAKWGLRCENKITIRALLDLARSIEPITTPGDAFDINPWLIGCETGVVDLQDGTLRDAIPEDNITMAVHYPYDADLGCPRWMDFLSEVFGGDAQLIAFIQMAVGYSITGDTREQCLFLCWGSGCNGKTVFLNTIRAMLGDYATNTAFSTFELEARSTIPNDIAALVGKRLVTASETAEAKRLNEARVKAITGGDPITCRFMRGEYFSYTPAYKVWLAMNHKPVVTGTDNGIWRRIRLIPFNVSFAGREDKLLSGKLLAELPGILAWAVQGALIWQDCGMVECEAVTMATTQYREESDLIGQFMSECTDRIAVGQVSTSDLFHEYERWCREMNEQASTANAFRIRMTDMGIVHKREHSGRFYKGIAIKSREPLADTERIPL